MSFVTKESEQPELIVNRFNSYKGIMSFVTEIAETYDYEIKQFQFL